MNIGAALVLYAVVWFMTLFIVLPLRLTSQQEAGSIVPGTPASAPTNPQLGKRAIIVTIVATLVWIGLVAIIASGIIPLSWFDFYSGIEK
jgi:predicted secreted protein